MCMALHKGDVVHLVVDGEVVDAVAQYHDDGYVSDSVHREVHFKTLGDGE